MSSKYVDKEFDDIDEEIESSEKLYQVIYFISIWDALDFTII